MEEYEYAIVGQGAAAFAAALKADELGIKTVMIGKNETNGTLLGGTCVNEIYAAGDVTGEPMLEALAAAEGNKATVNAFTGEKLTVDLNSVPSAVFIYKACKAIDVFYVFEFSKYLLVL